MKDIALTLIIIGISATPGAAWFSLDSITPALEQARSIYSLFNFDTPEPTDTDRFGKGSAKPSYHRLPLYRHPSHHKKPHKGKPQPVYGRPQYVQVVQRPHGYNQGKDDIKLKKIKNVWDGHIPVGDIVSPVLSAVGVGDGDYHDHVVQGYDNRIGFRLAIPYFGDLQLTRELGPGRYLDHLGPGKFNYPGLSEAHLGGYDYGTPSSHYGPPSDHYGAPKNSEHSEEPSSYQSLQNYPWYRR